MYLEKLNDVSDIKKLNFKELKILAQEMRDLITKSTDKCGGHLSSNLGVVELTQALYYVFDFENDKLIFDVGHQCYAHKILSGRKNEFVNLRKYGGLSGFPDRSESVFDAVATGHASTSLSLGLGLSVARDLHHKDYNVICVIGDGALSGGQSFEALNNIGIQKSGMIILLNDNEMSISKSNGVFLSKLRLSKSYEGFKNKFKFFGKFPLIGKITLGFMRFVRNVLKAIFVPVNIFDHFSINYYGPFDGHKTKKLIKLLQKAKGTKKPIVIHVLTKKGRGLIAAETAPDVFHGVKSGNECSNSVFSKGMGEFLCELAEKDKRIVAVTAAMSAGTGLTDFSKKFPERFFDVGICEQHAVTFSAGLADEGLAPYFCVYSTFLQRGFDQVIIDVCLNKLPVTFLIDRSGLVGADGKTHHGIFDLSILSCIPNLTILSPCDLSELKKMMEFSVNFNAPLAIRFCNDYAGELKSPDKFVLGKWEYLQKHADCKNVIAASGNRMLHLAKSAAQNLKDKKNIDINVLCVNSINPIDTKTLSEIANCKIVLIEDNIKNGGLGSLILNYYNQAKISADIKILALSDYVTHGSVVDLLKSRKLDIENISKYFL